MADLLAAGSPAPSQIQQFTWPLAMLNSDIIGISASDDTKSLAYLLPIFAHIVDLGLMSQEGEPPCFLVIVPTREVAMQIETNAKQFGQSSNIRVACIYGGAAKGPQAAAIQQGVHGVIGTPNRINDFLEHRQLRLDRLVTLVIDEADRIFDMGFEPQLRRILRHAPTERQTLCFSTDWPTPLQRLSSEFLRSPFLIQIGNGAAMHSNQVPTTGGAPVRQQRLPVSATRSQNVRSRSPRQRPPPLSALAAGKAVAAEQQDQSQSSSQMAIAKTQPSAARPLPPWHRAHADLPPPPSDSAAAMAPPRPMVELEVCD